jgi:hypothetical protein
MPKQATSTKQSATETVAKESPKSERSRSVINVKSGIVTILDGNGFEIEVLSIEGIPENVAASVIDASASDAACSLA